MIIEFQRKGGFGGVTISTTVDTNKLSSEESKKIQSMVEASNFFNIESNINASEIKGSADLFKYKISIKNNDGKTKHTLETTDLNMDDRIRPLVDYLQEEAVKSKMSK